MVTNATGSITAGTWEALVQKLAALQGFEQATGSFMFQSLICNTEDTTTC